jgi:uncharacterized protein (DUF2336 family)
MPAVREVLDQLECSLQSSSSSQLLQILRSVTDLYLDGAATYSEETIELFDHTLSLLIEYVETRALAKLSAQLAPIDMAPLRAVRRLARHDEISVAEPLLCQSKRLSTIDLVEIANTKSQAHLAAIGNRPEIEEAVTDVLVAKGNSDVARIVAANSGARFSETGFSQLVFRAEAEVGLAELVSIRSEMSAQHFQQLVLRATDTVRRRLTSISDPRVHARIKRELAQISLDIDRAAGTRERNYSSAQSLVYSMWETPTILRSKLLEFATQAQFEETVVSLAVLSELGLSEVEKIMMNDDDGGVMLLCKGIGLDWTTAHAILSLRPTVGLRATVAIESRPRFEKLSVSTAKQVLRFWQVRTSLPARCGS